jgi:hypothetical protein
MRTAYRIVKVPRRDRLLHRDHVAGVRISAHSQPNTLTKVNELVPHIPRTVEAPELHELLVAELLRKVRLGPLVPQIEQRKMISPRMEKILPRLVGV